MSLTTIIKTTLRSAAIGLTILVEQGCGTLFLQDPYSCYEGLSLDAQIDRYVQDIYRKANKMKNCAEGKISVDNNGSYVCLVYVEAKKGNPSDNKLIQIFVPGHSTSQQPTLTIYFDYDVVNGENYLQEVSFTQGENGRFTLQEFSPPQLYFLQPTSPQDQKTTIRQVLQDTLFYLNKP